MVSSAISSTRPSPDGWRGRSPPPAESAAAPPPRSTTMEPRHATHAGQDGDGDGDGDGDNDDDDDDDDDEVHHYGAIACYSFRLSNAGVP